MFPTKEQLQDKINRLSQETINNGLITLSERLRYKAGQPLINTRSSNTLPSLLFTVKDFKTGTVQYYLNINGIDRVYQEIDPVLAEQSKHVEYNWHRLYKFKDLLKSKGKILHWHYNPWEAPFSHFAHVLRMHVHIRVGGRTPAAELRHR